MSVMSKFSSEYAQLLEPLIQCVCVVVCLADDSAMLKRSKSAVNGTPMDVGAAREIGHSAWSVEVVANTECRP